MWHIWGRFEECRNFGGEKSEGKGTLERPRRRWEDNIEIDLEEMG